MAPPRRPPRRRRRTNFVRCFIPPPSPSLLVLTPVCMQTSSTRTVPSVGKFAFQTTYFHAKIEPFFTRNASVRTISQLFTIRTFYFAYSWINFTENNGKIRSPTSYVKTSRRRRRRRRSRTNGASRREFSTTFPRAAASGWFTPTRPGPVLKLY